MVEVKNKWMELDVDIVLATLREKYPELRVKYTADKGLNVVYAVFEDKHYRYCSFCKTPIKKWMAYQAWELFSEVTNDSLVNSMITQIEEAYKGEF